MGADLERERALKEKLDAFQKQNVALMRLLACNGQVRRGDVVKEYEISQFSYTTLIDALSTEQVADILDSPIENSRDFLNQCLAATSLLIEGSTGYCQAKLTPTDPLNHLFSRGVADKGVREFSEKLTPEAQKTIIAVVGAMTTHLLASSGAAVSPPIIPFPKLDLRIPATVFKNSEGRGVNHPRQNLVQIEQYLNGCLQNVRAAKPPPNPPMAEDMAPPGDDFIYNVE